MIRAEVVLRCLLCAGVVEKVAFGSARGVGGGGVSAPMSKAKE